MALKADIPIMLNMSGEDLTCELLQMVGCNHYVFFIAKLKLHACDAEHLHRPKRAMLASTRSIAVCGAKQRLLNTINTVPPACCKTSCVYSSFAASCAVDWSVCDHMSYTLYKSLAVFILIAAFAYSQCS